ncbi:hypothetical protein M0811_03421 [Anaeramoeba ignava]|uniref:TLDc domain-containing protein n=1 Tax=Anaeramoeba ignava TaxID=1746090 RepID=A0A9Q0R4G7_ANAIG|nr:hypothetical protein M0811_03421 [Anaeramoeba ignava]
MKRKFKKKKRKLKEEIKKSNHLNQKIKISNLKIKIKNKENENKEKKIKSFESENQNLKQENQKKEKENQNLKQENQKKEKDIQNLKSENEKKEKIIKQKDKEIQNIKLSFEKENQKEESKQNQNKLLKIFSNSEIVKDKEYVKKLQEWINDNDFFSKMKKGFSAKNDGFDSQNWHKAVDGKGKTLVIIKTKDNFIFGGFTQVGWTNDTSKWSEEHDGGNWGYIKDENAFIFSLRNDKGDRKPEKFTIQQGKEKYAIEHDLKDGPTFGSFDFRLKDKLQPGYSNFGNIYNLPNGITYGTNEAKSYLAGSYDEWVVDELETYFI